MGKNMMAFSWFLWVVGLVFLIFTTNYSVHADSEATCRDCIRAFVGYCKPYLLGQTANPSSNCCMGLDNTFGGITKHKTRKTICECFHRLAARDGYKPDRAKKLVKICNVPFPVPLAPSADDCKHIR